KASAFGRSATLPRPASLRDVPILAARPDTPGHAPAVPGRPGDPGHAVPIPVTSAIGGLTVVKVAAMKAIIQTDPDNPRALEWGDAPKPEIGDGEVLVKVRAAAVNRADILQARGHYPPP